MATSLIFQNTTKVYFGDHLNKLPEEIKKLGTKVLLTYGYCSVKKSGLLDKVKSILNDNEITTFEFGGIDPNPRHTTVNEGAEYCRKNGIEVLLALGGGSVIDCTKAIAAAVFYKGDCWDLITKKVPVVNALPIFAVLTVSAAGSEMNGGCVISNLDTNDKVGLVSQLLLPKVSILDPINTYSVSAFQTAAGSADIIAHVMDCYYFSRGEKLDMIDQIMETVFRMVVKYAPIAIKEPDNYVARANLMWAATRALNDFLATGVEQAPSCHCIEHELSAFYDITHGLGLAIIMPRWMKYILNDSTAADIKKFGVNIFDVDPKLSDREGAEETIRRFEHFLFDVLGLERTLTAVNIDDKNFKTMANKACGGSVMRGYRDLTPNDVENILRMCL